MDFYALHYLLQTPTWHTSEKSHELQVYEVWTSMKIYHNSAHCNLKITSLLILQKSTAIAS